MRAGGWDRESCQCCSKERAREETRVLDIGEQTGERRSAGKYHTWLLAGVSSQCCFHKEALSKDRILVSHQEEIVNIQN